MKRFSLIFTSLIIAALMAAGFSFAQMPGLTVQRIPGISTGGQLSDAYQRLTPAQRQALEEEMRKTGGRVTPATIEALKNRPEFQGVPPSDLRQYLDAYQQLTPVQRQALTPEAMEALKAKPEYKGITPEEVARGKELLEIKKREAITMEEKEVSLFNRYRQLGKYQNIPLDLKPFGYEFFQTASVRVVTDRGDMPVPQKYVVGPGDEVRILLWGRVNAQYNLVVDRDGKITIPQIGPVFVAGRTFEDMSKEIIKQAEQIVGTNVDVTLGALKTIPIFVLGDVRRPGAYTIGSFATITDALLMAGGPTEIGSMRNVQLRRKGQTVAVLDLYDLFLKGDKSKDMTLMAGDVVFVPVTGPLVGIAGHVKRPAIYELKDRRDLMGLIELAGGVIPSAYTRQIQVERIVQSEKQIVIDIDDKHLAKARQFMLEDADLIKVFPIVETDHNVINLMGNVKRPGKYEYKKGMKIGDILKDPVEDLLPETHLDYALIKRQQPPLMNTVLLPVNLRAVLLEGDEKQNIELMPKDQIFVFSKWFFEEKPFVTIEGEIRGECQVDEKTETEPQKIDYKKLEEMRTYLSSIEKELTRRGRYDIVQMVQDILSNLNIGKIPPSDNFFQLRRALLNANETAYANQILDFENQTRISASRTFGERIRTLQSMNTTFLSMDDELSKRGRLDLAGMVKEILSDLNAGITPTESKLFKLRLALANAGETLFASQVLEFENQIRVACRIKLSDDMKVRDAILAAGGLTNEAFLDKAHIVRKDKEGKFHIIYFNVEKALAGDPTHNVALQKEDKITIHSLYEHERHKFVTVDGEVAKPGNYQYTEGMRVKDLIFKGGNVLESAYLDEAEISSLIIEDAKITRTEKRTINLRRALANDPEHNVSLRPHDRLLVKRITDWGAMKYVTLTGEFRFPGRYAIHKGERLSSVIERAGGYLPTAYLRGAYFTRESVRALQQKSLEEMTRRLERELLSEASARIGTALSPEEVQSKAQEVQFKQRLIEFMRGLKATGRMSIALTNLRLLKGSVYDIELEDGDVLHLPQKNNVVNVVGAVMAETSHVFKERWSFTDYINASGGLARYADEANIFVLKVDGSARKLSGGLFNWSERRDRWELAGYGEETPTIEPGDVIVVPEKVTTIAWLREIRDITQILMNTAVTAATIIKLW